MRVVDENSEQLGILPTRDAYDLAMERGLDLVEVAPNERPPVCRIMDYGKFKYEQKKKQQESRKKQHTIHIKEVRIRPKTDTHDVEIKSNRAHRFLEEGHKVQITMYFRGREMAHRDRGFEILKSFATALEDIAKVERPPSMDGRRMVMILMRKPGYQPRPKPPKVSESKGHSDQGRSDQGKSDSGPGDTGRQTAEVAPAGPGTASSGGPEPVSGENPAAPPDPDPDTSGSSEGNPAAEPAGAPGKPPTE